MATYLPNTTEPWSDCKVFYTVEHRETKDRHVWTFSGTFADEEAARKDVREIEQDDLHLAVGEKIYARIWRHVIRKFKDHPDFETRECIYRTGRVIGQGEME